MDYYTDDYDHHEYLDAILTPEELLERQWEHFIEDEVDYEWADELHKMGPEILAKPDAWVQWCWECLEVRRDPAQWLGTSIKVAFEKYKKEWNV